MVEASASMANGRAGVLSPVLAPGIVQEETRTASERAPYTPGVMAGGPTDGATLASIKTYLAAGDGFRVVADVLYKACIGLLVLLVMAWALGWLPATFPLF